MPRVPASSASRHSPDHRHPPVPPGDHRVRFGPHQIAPVVVDGGRGRGSVESGVEDLGAGVVPDGGFDPHGATIGVASSGVGLGGVQANTQLEVTGERLLGDRLYATRLVIAIVSDLRSVGTIRSHAPVCRNGSSRVRSGDELPYGVEERARRLRAWRIRR